MQVLDWLLSNASGEWHVDKTGAHKVHAMVWKHIIEAAQQIGPEDPEACLKAIGTYCVRHALTHFLLAMRGGDASPATSSLHFIAATAHAGEVLRLLRGAAQASNAGRSSSLAAPRAWIRCMHRDVM